MAGSEKQQRYWVGFDLGGTKMLATVYDDSFKVLGKKRKRTKGNEGAKAGVQRMVATIGEALDDAKLDASLISGMGVGCPGPLDLERGILHGAPNLGWYDVPLKDALQDVFRCPAVVANDVDLGVYGEYRFGAGKNARCVVGIFPGTGIGGGCVYEGKIFRGRNLSCMEIGHIPILMSGPLDGCGNQGCLEALASRLAIASSAAQAAFRGQAPHLLENAGTDIGAIRSGVLARAIEAGDTVVEDLVRQAACYIGHSAIIIVHLMAPDVIVLGGGLAEAMPELFVKTVEKTVRGGVLETFRGTFDVRAAKLGDDATVQGAAAWAKTSFAETE